MAVENKRSGAVTASKSRDAAWRDRGPGHATRPRQKGFWRDTFESLGELTER